MSREKNNRKTILLGVLLIAILVGVCFFCVALYAKNEINKPKFTMPDQPELPSVSPLPTNKDEAFAYVSRLYEAVVSADDAEGSWHTDVHPDGEWIMPFDEADQAVVLFIRDQASSQIASFYPCVDGVRMTDAQDIPQLGIQAHNVLDFTAEQGKAHEDGSVTDNDYYYLTLTVDPAVTDTEAMTQSDVFRSITDELSSVALLSSTQIEAQSVTMRFTVDRLNDHLLSVEIDRAYRVQTVIRSTQASAALIRQEETITLPYATTQHVEFTYYGARFLERAITVKPDDMKALPAEVTVNADATKDDYTLTFTSSEPDVLSFDEDGVMTVNKACDDPVTVTMTLEYDGHTYSDALIVYVSEWEVVTDVAA